MGFTSLNHHLARITLICGTFSAPAYAGVLLRLLGFTREDDARRAMEVLPKRLGKYGLTLHPDKTRLVPFRRPPLRMARKSPPGEAKPGTFDLLGFTHFWGRSQKGNWVAKRKTARSRLSRALRTVGQWCRWNRHRPVAEQHDALIQKLRGHYAYYGITGNGNVLSGFHRAVTRLWRKWLGRRKRAAPIPWTLFQRLLERYPLPRPVIVHAVYRGVANP
jgi:hypothetical protein